MIADIADALLPVFFVMALGFLAGKRRTIDNLNVGSINSLVMTFAIRSRIARRLAFRSWEPCSERPPTSVWQSLWQLRITKPVILATLVALLVQPLFGAAIAVLVHVPVAYAHVAILILAIPGGFFGVLFGDVISSEEEGLEGGGGGGGGFLGEVVVRGE